MSERIVFITGANGGLGTFVTQSFLQLGDKVIGASRHVDSSEFPSPNFRAISVDFTNPQQVRDAIAKVISEFGHLDVLVHVLGGFAGGQSIATTDDGTWERMQDLTLTSAFYVVREPIPHLRNSKNGRIWVLTLPSKPPSLLWCKPSRWKTPTPASPRIWFSQAPWILRQTARPCRTRISPNGWTPNASPT